MAIGLSPADDTLWKARRRKAADTLGISLQTLDTAGGTFLLTSSALLSFYSYRRWLRRIPDANAIPTRLIGKGSVFGRVTAVGDGDNFRVFHTPGGRLAGWGWLPWRRVPEKSKLKDQTIHVRIAGVDAPELAHFGRPAQPGSQDALDWLRNFVLDRRVRVHLHRRDQYQRIVGTAYVRRSLFRKDVGLEMLRAGMATVYEAKSGAEFGGKESTYRDAEAVAKRKRKGIWAEKNFESPREYKTRMGVEEKGDAQAHSSASQKAWWRFW